MSMARLCLLLLIMTAPVFAQPRTEMFEVVKVAEGVYAAIRKEPPGLMSNANSVFIITERDVIVIDTALTPSAARELVAALRKLTDKPVKYVINTHGHEDHVIGNRVFSDAYPQAQFVAHINTREYLSTTAPPRIEMAKSGMPDIIKTMSERLEKNVSFFGGPMSDEERATYTSDIKIAESYLAESTNVNVPLPTVTVLERLTLREGSRTIELMYLGRGHTSGDLVIYLPAERILIAGDLAAWPVPKVDYQLSRPKEWSATLEKMLALKPSVIIPGHGPVLRDDSHLRLISRLFTYISRKAEAAVADGKSVEQLRESIDLDEFQKAFAGDSRMRRLRFRNNILYSAINVAYADARAKR